MARRSELTTKTKDDLRPAWSRSGARIAFEGVDTDSDWRSSDRGDRWLPHEATNNARTDVTPGW